jgi:hypothetical protein
MDTEEIRKSVLQSVICGEGEELSDGIMNLLVDVDFAEERMRLQAKSDALRCEVAKLRIQAAVGLDVEDEHASVVKQMLQLSVEMLYNEFSGDDVIDEVMRQAKEEGLLEEDSDAQVE